MLFIVKKRLPSSILALFIIVLGLAACDDIIEQDISQEEIFLLAPQDSLFFTDTVETEIVNFWWEPVQGARQYHFQLLSPDFLSPQRLLLDSVTLENSVSVALTPGSYGWRVQASNGAYATTYYGLDFVLIK